MNESFWTLNFTFGDFATWCKSFVNSSNLLFFFRCANIEYTMLTEQVIGLGQIYILWFWRCKGSICCRWNIIFNLGLENSYVTRVFQTLVENKAKLCLQVTVRENWVHHQCLRASHKLFIGFVQLSPWLGPEYK